MSLPLSREGSGQTSLRCTLHSSRAGFLLTFGDGDLLCSFTERVWILPLPRLAKQRGRVVEWGGGEAHESPLNTASLALHMAVLGNNVPAMQRFKETGQLFSLPPPLVRD